MILRHGAGHVEQQCTKQLWIQEATKNYNIFGDKVVQEHNIANTLAHEVLAHVMEHLVTSMSWWRPGVKR